MEVMGFIIILLVMVGVMIRRLWLKRTTQSDRLSESANQLQLQLEEAADTIIKRMENHVNHLEFLIEEADGKITQLDEKIKLMEELAVRSEQPPEKRKIAAQLPTAHLGSTMAEAASIESLSVHTESENRQKKKSRKIQLKPSKLNATVIAMLEEGHTLDEIAKQTAIGKGAILLIQGMYKSEKVN